MTQVDEIERLQIELQENPKSLQFVRLAELYLERELVTEAERLILQSLKFHPKSVSGLLLLGRIYKRLSKPDNSLQYLTTATRLAPDNWQAWLTKAEVFADLQKGKDALACFKKVLYLNPTHPVARRAVARLEVLTADDYDEDLFSMKPLQSADLQSSKPVPEQATWGKIPGALERSLALIDALTVRLDIKKALELLNDCTKKYGSHPEIESRRLRLTTYDTPDFISPKATNKTSLAKRELIQSRKVLALQELLRRIEHKQRDRLSTQS